MTSLIFVHPVVSGGVKEYFRAYQQTESRFIHTHIYVYIMHTSSSVSISKICIVICQNNCFYSQLLSLIFRVLLFCYFNECLLTTIANCVSDHLMMAFLRETD